MVTYGPGHEGPVMQQVFPYHEVILNRWMWNNLPAISKSHQVFQVCFDNSPRI